MRRLLIASIAFAATGCLDLSLPSKAPADPGPTVQFVSPTDGQLVRLNSFLQLDITSLHGVKSVFVYCSPNLSTSGTAGVCGGGTLLEEWQTIAPFEDVIDFSPCARGLTPVNGDAGPEVDTVLCAQATDGNDVTGAASVAVRLDVGAPVLTIVAPPRVASGGPLDIGITSDRALIADPVVQVEGSSAMVTQDATNPLHFVAHLAQAPLLGIDAFDGGADADVPIEVLEDTERPLPISIDARGQNGNTTHLSYQVLVSRVLWQVNVPGIIAGQPDAGSAFNCPDLPLSGTSATGVELPLWTGIDRLEGGPVCAPGFFEAADGTYVPAPTPLGDAGTLLGFDREGDAFVQDIAGTFFLAPPSFGVSTPVTDPFKNLTRFQRVGPETLCQSSPNFGLCSTSITCLSVDGGITVDNAAPFEADPSLELISGGTYLWYADPTSACYNANCPCTPFLTIGTPGAMSRVATPFGTGVPVTILPVNAGFVVTYNTSVTQVGLLNPAGQLTSDSWPTNGAVPYFAFLDGRAVSSQFLNTNGYTVFSAWDKNAPGPVATARVPGVLPGISQTFGWLGAGGYVATDTKLAILVQTIPGMGVLVFDHSLRPQWLYRYPFPAVPVSVQLIGDSTGTVLYLVDLGTERVTALPW